MEVLKLDQSNEKIYKQVLKKVLQVLKSGGVIVYPTETSYGLGADPFNKIAIEKVYQIKLRPKNKRLPLIAGNFHQVKKFFKLNKTEKDFAQKHWPGPYTLILERLSKQDGFAFDYTTCAIRVSSNEFARDLALKLGHPIISTSANISGTGNLYDVKEILEQFKNKKHQPDIIVDFGKLKKRRPSKIIMFVNNKLQYIRK